MKRSAIVGAIILLLPALLEAPALLAGTRQSEPGKPWESLGG